MTGNFSAVANGTYDSVRAFAIRGSELFVAARVTVSSYIGIISLTTNQWIPMPSGGPIGM